MQQPDLEIATREAATAEAVLRQAEQEARAAGLALNEAIGALLAARAGARAAPTRHYSRRPTPPGHGNRQQRRRAAATNRRR